MMAELEIDQSNLPRVREVCECFAVLEDGVLAHNLQEQEIEQYYTTNIQKNQLVQNDIRVAKKLQDEEEEEQAQQSTLLRQASRQLEEEDFEYARVIQEEIQRCAEEARRREQEDEEIAKRMQEEEEQRITRRSHSEGSASGPALPSPHQHTLSSSLHQREEQYSSTTTRCQWPTSHNHSDITRPQADSLRGVAAQRNTSAWSNQGHPDSIREIRRELGDRLSEDSEDSDTVFSEHLTVRSQRLNERLNTAPPRRQASLHHPHERNYRSVRSRSCFTKEERGEWNEDFYENCDLERRKPRNWGQEKNHGEETQGLHRNRDQDRDCRLVEIRERRCSCSESVRLPDRSKHSNRDLARTWSYKDNPDKHVRFQDNTRSSNRQQGETSAVWEMLGQVLRERGVPVRFGSNGAPLQIRPQSRDSQVLHGSEVSCSDSRPHQRAFQRAANTRHSFHGDIRERRGLSYQENSRRDHREDRDGHHNNVEHDCKVYEINRDMYLANRNKLGSRRWRGQRNTNDDERERNANDCRVRRTTSERRLLHQTMEERLSSEEEQERRVEQPHRKAPQRSQSLSSSSSSRASTRDRSRHLAAGVSLQPEPGKTSLDLGELRQVLQDEELAHTLQEEEEKRLRRNSQPSPCSAYPEGDFRVAQVAQDEEIARFMQKQEIKSKQRARELEGPALWREHRAMISHRDRRAAGDQPFQRERRDSEGLPSPTECSPENQPPSPFSTIPQAQQIRNIAEELDPTFQARRESTESLRVGQAGPACETLPMPHSGLHDLLEEPTFIPPTKRQTDKSGRTKLKEKKENCKQQ